MGVAASDIVYREWFVNSLRNSQLCDSEECNQCMLCLWYWFRAATDVFNNVHVLLLLFFIFFYRLRLAAKYDQYIQTHLLNSALYIKFISQYIVRLIGIKFCSVTQHYWVLIYSNECAQIRWCVTNCVYYIVHILSNFLPIWTIHKHPTNVLFWYFRKRVFESYLKIFGRLPIRSFKESGRNR